MVMQTSTSFDKWELASTHELATIVESLHAHERHAEARLLAALDDTVEEPGATVTVRANDLAVVLKVVLAEELAAAPDDQGEK
jgi:hypothetical protein